MSPPPLHLTRLLGGSEELGESAPSVLGQGQGGWILDRLGAMTCWCASAGVAALTVYDADGSIAASVDDLVRTSCSALDKFATNNVRDGSPKQWSSRRRAFPWVHVCIDVCVLTHRSHAHVGCSCRICRPTCSGQVRRPRRHLAREGEPRRQRAAKATVQRANQVGRVTKVGQ